MSDPFKEPLARIPIPKSEAATLALQLSRKASGDIKSCKIVLKGKQYSNAAQNLQQAVEKASKGFGLVAGTLKPTDENMKEVSHYSFRAFISDFWSFYPTLMSAINAVNAAVVDKTFESPLFRKMGSSLKQAARAMNQVVPDEGKLRDEIEELKRLDPATMWRASLNLDETNKWIKEAIHGIHQAPVITGNLDSLFSIARSAMGSIGIFTEEEVLRLKFASALGVATQKGFSLSILTAWHLEPSRYPPGQRGYWTQEAYTKDAPFVKFIPTLVDHSEVMIANVTEAAETALLLSS